MGVLVVSSSFSVVFEDEQVDSPISSSFSPEFEDERITGRGCFLRGFGGFTKIIVIFAGSEGGDRVTVVGYFLIVPGRGD